MNLHRSRNVDGKTYVILGVCFALLLMVSVLETERWFASGSTPAPADVLTSDVSIVSDSVLALPTVLRAPAIGLVAPFGDPLGLQPNQEVAVPTVYDAVGWYRYSPIPGELGPAVVLGHVDSREGPAVFYELGQLTVGDEVIIERADATEAVFVVTATKRYEQTDFPTTLVYGDLDHSGLRLVTCSGAYDTVADRYTHNRVVFAELQTIRPVTKNNTGG